MDHTNTEATPTRRRDRRSAERKAAHNPRPTRRPVWQSPIALVTGGALIVGELLIGALQLLPSGSNGGPAQPGTKTAAGILVPLVGTPANLTDGRSLGRADAPVKLIVWSDFQCPACRIFATQIKPSLTRDYVASGKLRLEYRDYILIGPQSTDLAAAARCADEQGAFWPFHNVTFANQGIERSGWATKGKIADLADAVGLNRPTFDACVASGVAAAAATAETATGRGRVTSTPTLDFGSQVIAGSPPYEQLVPIIDELLAAAAASGSAGSSPAASATP